MARSAGGGSPRIVIEATALAKALALAATVVESRNTIPILSNVWLRAEGQQLEIATTDLDVEFRRRLPLAQPIDAVLAITVDAKRLAALAAAAPAGAQLSLEVESAARAIVKAGRSRWVLPALPTDDFPLVPDAAGEARMSFAPASRFAAALDQVLWTCSTEVTRYYLGGPLFHPEGGQLRLAATNGHTLMAVQLTENWADGAPEVILGAKFCRTLARLAGDDAGTLQVSWNAKRMVAELGDVTLTGKVIDGSFPDYRRVIPPIVETPLVFDAGDLSGAIRRVQLVATEKTRVVTISPEAGKVVVGATDPNGGTAQEEMAADSCPAPQRGFNGAYLLRALEAVGGETIEMHHQDPGSPALLRRPTEPAVLGVVMPLRV